MTPLQTAVQNLLQIFHRTGNSIDDPMRELRKSLDAEMQQAVKPVAWKAHIQTARNVYSDYLDVQEALNYLEQVFLAATPAAMHLSEILAEKGITLRTEFEEKPRDTAPPATGERAELIARIKHELAEFAHNKTLETLLLDAADMLEADVPKRDKQWHDTAWQRGFQMGVSTNKGTAQQACDALATEQAAHRETNRMMTEALMQAEAQQVAVLPACNRGNLCPWSDEGSDGRSHCRRCGATSQGSGQ